MELDGAVVVGQSGDHIELKKAGALRRLVVPKYREIPVFIITDWQKAAIFKSQLNAKRLHTFPTLRKSIGFLPPDVNLKSKTPAFMLEKSIENNLKTAGISRQRYFELLRKI